MDPLISKSTKTRVNLACPVCGMDLKKAPNGGFAKYGETYCCQGCADGTGCTCSAGVEVKKSFSRPGDIGWRNAGNRPHDKNYNVEEDNMSTPIAKRARKSKAMPSRDQRQNEPRSKRLKTANKAKDSTREQARGRAEERGRMAKPASPRMRSRGGDRISRTGSKGK
jgi:hypothetical protein